jgi:hypothetical protein
VRWLRRRHAPGEVRGLCAGAGPALRLGCGRLSRGGWPLQLARAGEGVGVQPVCPVALPKLCLGRALALARPLLRSPAPLGARAVQQPHSPRAHPWPLLLTRRLSPPTCPA